MIFYINSLINISVSIMQSSIEKHFENIIKNNESINDLLNTWNSKDNKKALDKILKKFSSSRKKKGSKKGPKKAHSAYLYFCQAERPKIKKDKSELSPTEILSECGTRWSLIKDKPKMIKKYQDLADKDKDRYKKEMETFIPDESESSDDEKPKKKRKSNGLKKNKTAFLFFSSDERQKIKDEGLEISAKEILTEIGGRWKVFQESNPNGVKKYEQMASEDKIRYENEKNNLVSPPETSDEVENSEVVEEKVDKPKPKRSNGYVNFCKEKRPEVKEENSDVSAANINSILSKIWKELSEEDKAGYNTN